jgi:hypothetical protein
MNSFALVSATHEDWGRYLEIEIDGKRLAHHFADRMGAHPSFLSPLGWRKNRKLHSSVIAKMLGDPPSNLGSSRVTVLFGDFDDGEFSVLILKESDHVRWTDWAYETDWEDPDDPESPEPPDWPTKPGDFLFDRESYEAVLREHLQLLPSSWVARLLAILEEYLSPQPPR